MKNLELYLLVNLLKWIVMINKVFQEVIDLNNTDKKNYLERFFKFNEEYGELNTEICKYIGITHKPFDREHLIEETADFLQNAMSVSIGICEEFNITTEELMSKITEKNEKWRSKIPLYTKNNK